MRTEARPRRRRGRGCAGPGGETWRSLGSVVSRSVTRTCAFPASALSGHRERGSSWRSTGLAGPNSPLHAMARRRPARVRLRPRAGDLSADRGGGGGALDAELVLVAGDREARAVLLHHERVEAAPAPVGDGEEDVEVDDAGVRDPVLRAVDEPPVPVAEPHGRACASRQGRSPPPARTGKKPATTRRSRSAAATAAAAPRCAGAGLAACRAPAP